MYEAFGLPFPGKRDLAAENRAIKALGNYDYLGNPIPDITIREDFRLPSGLSCAVSKAEIAALSKFAREQFGLRNTSAPHARR